MKFVGQLTFGDYVLQRENQRIYVEKNMYPPNALYGKGMGVRLKSELWILKDNENMTRINHSPLWISCFDSGIRQFTFRWLRWRLRSTLGRISSHWAFGVETAGKCPRFRVNIKRLGKDNTINPHPCGSSSSTVGLNCVRPECCSASDESSDLFTWNEQGSSASTLFDSTISICRFNL